MPRSIENIRSPLIMRNDAQVRTMEELVENFDLQKAFSYLENGKLEKWLRGRNHDDEADKLNAVDITDAKKAGEEICRVLLPSDMVAYLQEDLNYSLESGKKKIYLYGGKFQIPLDKEDITYIGLDHPVICVDSLNWKDKNIQIEGCNFDSSYNDLLKKNIEDAKNECIKYYNDMVTRYPSKVTHTYKELEEVAKKNLGFYIGASKIQAESRQYYDDVLSQHPDEIMHSYEDLCNVAERRFTMYKKAEYHTDFIS